jgi:hypothetical protein
MRFRRVLNTVIFKAHVHSLSDTAVRQLLANARALVKPRVFTDPRGRRWEVFDAAVKWRWQ